MKLHHIAAAAALTLGAGLASAQSTVTIYGLLDLGIQKSNGGTAAWRDGPATKAYNLSESKGSRLGFRGNEDLGGGLSAQFQIEHRFTPDTGAANATFWQGASFVQLTSKDLGAVYLGRDYTPYRNVAIKVDPFGQDGVGKFDGGSRAYAGFGGGRAANSVGYKSPKFGGLSGALAVSLGEGTANREVAANLEYADGPLYIGGAFAQQTGPINTGTNWDDGKLYLLAASYNFGVIKPMLQYARAEVGLNGVNKNDFFLIGATAPVGPGLIKVGYGRYDPQGGNNNQQKFSLGYDYPLSKRTKFYGDISTSRQDGNFSKYNVFALGLQHNF